MTNGDNEEKELKPEKKIKFQTNKLKTTVGVINDKNLRFLAFFQKCDRNTCPIAPNCPYKNKARCDLEYNFLSGMYRDWTDPVLGLGDVLSQMQMDRIGTVIIPLYQLQLKLLKEIYLLPTTGYLDGSGKMTTYPQYASYFNAVNTLTREMRNLGLDELWESKFGNKDDIPKMKDIHDIITESPVRGYELAQGMIARLAKQKEREKALREQEEEE